MTRDTGDLRQSLSYPSNWWHGANGVNWENAAGVFGIVFDNSEDCRGEVVTRQH